MSAYKDRIRDIAALKQRIVVLEGLVEKLIYEKKLPTLINFAIKTLYKGQS